MLLFRFWEPRSFVTHVSSFWFLFDFMSVPFFVSSLSLSHRVSLVVSLFSMFFVISLCLICQSCVLVCVSVFVTCCFILIVSHSVWIVFSFTSSVSLVCYYFQVCSHLLHFLFLSCVYLSPWFSSICFLRCPILPCVHLFSVTSMFPL